MINPLPSIWFIFTLGKIIGSNNIGVIAINSKSVCSMPGALIVCEVPHIPITQSILKVFDPITLPTAKAGSFSPAAMNDVASSGKLLAAAITVMAIAD